MASAEQIRRDLEAKASPDVEYRAPPRAKSTRASRRKARRIRDSAMQGAKYAGGATGLLTGRLLDAVDAAGVALDRERLAQCEGVHLHLAEAKVRLLEATADTQLDAYDGTLGAALEEAHAAVVAYRALTAGTSVQAAKAELDAAHEELARYSARLRARLEDSALEAPRRPEDRRDGPTLDDRRRQNRRTRQENKKRPRRAQDLDDQAAMLRKRQKTTRRQARRRKRLALAALTPGSEPPKVSFKRGRAQAINWNLTDEQIPKLQKFLKEHPDGGDAMAKKVAGWGVFQNGSRAICYVDLVAKKCYRTKPQVEAALTAAASA